MVTATTRVRAEKQAYASNDEAWGDHLNEGVFDRFDEAIGQFLLKALTGNYTLDVQNYVADEARAPICRFTGTGSWIVTVPAVSYKRLVRNDCTGNLTITPSGGTGAVIRAGKTAWWYSDGSVAYVMDPTLDEIKTAAADVAMGGFKLTGAGKATSTNDVATLANKVHEFAAPTAPLAMNGQKITGGAAATAATDFATLSNRLDQFAIPTTAINFNSQLLNFVATPVAGTDAANRAFVQSEIASASSINLPSQTGQGGKYLGTNGTTPSWQGVAIQARSFFVGGW